MGLEGVNQAEDLPRRYSTPVRVAPDSDTELESIPDLFEWPENVWDDDHDLLPDNWQLPSCTIDCSCSCCPIGECEICTNCSCRDSAPHDLDTSSSDASFGWCGGRQDSPLLFSDISFMSEEENSHDSILALGGSPISSCNSSMSESLLRSPEMPQPAWRPLPPFPMLQDPPAVDSLPDLLGADLPDTPQSPDSSCHSWAPASFSPESPDASFSSVSSQEVGDEETTEA